MAGSSRPGRKAQKCVADVFISRKYSMFNRYRRLYNVIISDQGYNVVRKKCYGKINNKRFNC